MWFIGMLIGGIAGASFGGGGVIFGAIAGIFAGLWLKKLGMSEPDETRRKLDAMQARVDYFSNELLQLKQRVQKLDKGMAPVSTTVPHEQTGAEGSAEGDESALFEPAVTSAQMIEAPLVVENLPFSTIEAMESVAQKLAVTPAQAHTNVYAKTERPATTEESGFNLWKWFTTGNVLAKVGVVLLFFGVASALKLAADYGMFPVPVRLLLGSVFAVAMILFGWGRAQTENHRMFGLALQGGGVGILYLIVYFMLARYHLIGTTGAFVLFMLLGIGCVLLAAAQNGVSLAVLGISGAFLAPILASSQSGDHVVLFSYYALLNAFIISVNWFKSWRSLNIAGFIFTFAVGLMWAMQSYQPAYFISTESFLILFFLMYSATSVIFALFKAPGMKGWTEGMLVFGTPIAAAILQVPLMRDYEYGLAWSSFAAGIYYLGLWRALSFSDAPEMRIMEKSHLGIAIGFLTLAVPLAFGIQVTTAFWAIEGCAVLWFGIRQERYLARGFGILMQFVAGVYFVAHYQELSSHPALLNDFYVGGMILAVTALISAYLLHARVAESDKKEQSGLDTLMLYWGLFWWGIVNLGEIHRFIPDQHEPAAMLLFITATLAVMELIGKGVAWLDLRRFATLLLVIAAVAGFHEVVQHGHILQGFMVFMLPIAVAVHYWLLRRHEHDDINDLIGFRHVAAFLLLVWMGGLELEWFIQQQAPHNTLWPLLAWGVTAVAAIRTVIVGVEKDFWPFSAYREGYLRAAAMPVGALLFLWGLYANTTHAGGGHGLPYIPLLNPFDVVQILALLTLIAWGRAVSTADKLSDWANFAKLGSYLLGFVWISAMAARIAHHWGNVPFYFDALFRSVLLQSMLSLLWTTVAITLMIYASRKGRRNNWFAGFGLLALVGLKLLLVDMANAGTVAWTGSLIGVALLVIAASYFSPAPPKQLDVTD